MFKVYNSKPLPEVSTSSLTLYFPIHSVDITTEPNLTSFSLTRYTVSTLIYSFLLFLQLSILVTGLYPPLYGSILIGDKSRMKKVK